MNQHDQSYRDINAINEGKKESFKHKLIGASVSFAILVPVWIWALDILTK